MTVPVENGLLRRTVLALAAKIAEVSDGVEGPVGGAVGGGDGVEEGEVEVVGESAHNPGDAWAADERVLVDVGPGREGAPAVVVQLQPDVREDLVLHQRRDGELVVRVLVQADDRRVRDVAHHEPVGKPGTHSNQRERQNINEQPQPQPQPQQQQQQQQQPQQQPQPQLQLQLRPQQ